MYNVGVERQSLSSPTVCSSSCRFTMQLNNIVIDVSETVYSVCIVINMLFYYVIMM